MPDKRLHIIAFDIPYPSTYGGIIDVYYKIKSLHEAGVSISLHCFQYGDRKEQKKLEEITDSVHYYPRKTGWSSQLSRVPYIVQSRISDRLLENLLKDDAPILMEGIHCSYYIDHPALRDRKKILRMHNVEWKYYESLAEKEKNLGHKLYYKLESQKLKAYEKPLLSADHVLAVNAEDDLYFRSLGAESHLIPSFQHYEKALFQEKKENYILYQASLDVIENVEAAEWIIKNLVAQMPEYKFVFAGKNPRPQLLSKSEKYPNLEIISNPSEDVMEKLISHAQLNLVLTFQAIGIKQKLLRALFLGGHCIANSAAVFAGGVEDCSEIANTAEEIKYKINSLMHKDFSAEDFHKREKKLLQVYDIHRNAQKIIKLI